jgi:hypothetical protein
MPYISGVAIDAAGNIFVADGVYNRIYKLYYSNVAPTPTPTMTPSTTPYCQPGLFRPLPRTDLVGTLAGTALSPGDAVGLPSEAECRQACCDAAACDGYTFDASAARRTGAGDCWLYVNVTQLVPNSGMASGVYRSALS